MTINGLLTRWLLFFIILTLISLCDGETVNRTIDDQAGDSVTYQAPVFLPSTDVWAEQNCLGCTILPNSSGAFNGTYTQAISPIGWSNLSITMDFTGTAIYVFFILANNVSSGFTAITECYFFIDGVLAGSFTHQPDLTITNFEYNALAFSQVNLPNEVHQLVISNAGIAFSVYINFDYAIYTFVGDSPGLSPDPSSSSMDSTPTGILNNQSSPSIGAVGGKIAGGSIAGAFVLFSLGFLLYKMAVRGVGRHHRNPNSPYYPRPSRYRNSFLGVNQRSPEWFITSKPSPTWQPTTTHHDIAPPAPILRTSSNRVPELISRPWHDTGGSRISRNTSHRTRIREGFQLTRQDEISQRMRTIENDINRLSTTLNLNNGESQSRTTQGESGTAVNVNSREQNVSVIRELRDQIQAMRAHIRLLEEQQQSPWAQGLSDEPPPGYSR